MDGVIIGGNFAFLIGLDLAIKRGYLKHKRQDNSLKQLKTTNPPFFRFPLVTKTTGMAFTLGREMPGIHGSDYAMTVAQLCE